VPIWVVGLWPAPRSMRRAARWDGWLPNYRPPGAAEAGPSDAEAFRAGVSWLRDERTRNGLTMAGYDLVVEGTTPADDPAAAAAAVAPWREAGATWWLEADWSVLEADTSVRDYALARLAAGPPPG
jgi:hypothetical protein